MDVAAQIATGEVTLAFRSWKRPTVKAGGTLLTVAGQLAIDAVDPIDPAAITDADARAAGATDAEALRSWLREEPGRTTYRIAFHLAGPDPRIALRAASELDDEELGAIVARLEGWDRRSPTGPWTRAVLAAIADRPGVVSTELAASLGEDRARFKARVRQLKGLGLTESLEVGYRLSPRGATVLGGLDRS
jgi:hypothetical protein